MNLGKIKNFLIILFLGINIYLVISLVMSSEFRISDTTVENTVSILNKVGIAIDKGIISKKTVNLKNIETDNIIYTDEFRHSDAADDFKIFGDRFEYSSADSSLYSKSEKKIKSEIRALLTDAGFDVHYMKFGSVKKENGSKSFQINCVVKGFEIFDSKITVTVEKDGCTLSGRWYEPQSSSVKPNSRARKIVYITGVLVDLASNEDLTKSAPVGIEKIECGYMSGSLYGDNAHVTATALPYYRITDSNGESYFYNASDGTYNPDASTK